MSPLDLNLAIGFRRTWRAVVVSALSRKGTGEWARRLFHASTLGAWAQAGLVSLAFALGATANWQTGESRFQTALSAAPPRSIDIERMLELAWSNSSEHRESAEGLFEQLAESTNRDSALIYAQTLAKIKQRRYADALKLAEELTAAEPKNLQYAQTRVWLLVLLRKPEQGLVALGKLLGQLPPPPDPSADDTDGQLELIRFAGRVHGFLEGPGTDWLAESIREGHRRKLVDALAEPRKTAFLEGRDSVMDRWLGQKDDQQATRDKVKKDQEQQREERLSDLDRQREVDERRASELNDERSKLRGELNDQMADFQRQERPLIDQVNRLETQATVVRRDLAVVSSDVARLEGLLLRERDPLLRDQYRRDLARLDTLASRYQANLAGLVRQAATLNSQRADIQRRAAQVQQSIGRQLDGVDKEQTEAQKRTRAADGEERRLRKMPLGDSTQLRSMSAQSTAFTTYVAFPIEEARERLIDSLKRR